MEAPLTQLKPTNRTLKRAQYEAFEFSLLDGDVLVRNCSHADPSAHEYRVTVVDTLPATCECPADQIYDHPCKHRVAIAIRPAILEFAAQVRVLTDGGTASDVEDMRSPIDEHKPEECDCAVLSDDFPCWPCVESGRRSLSE